MEKVSKDTPDNELAVEKGRGMFVELSQARALCLRVLRLKKRLLLSRSPSGGGTACSPEAGTLPTSGEAARGAARTWAGSLSTTFSLLCKDAARAPAAAASSSCFAIEQ